VGERLSPALRRRQDSFPPPLHLGRHAVCLRCRREPTFRIPRHQWDARGNDSVGTRRTQMKNKDKAAKPKPVKAAPKAAAKPAPKPRGAKKPSGNR